MWMVFSRVARYRLGNILQLTKACRHGLNQSLPETLKWIARANFDSGAFAKIRSRLVNNVRALLGNRVLFSYDDIPELDEEHFVDYVRTHKTVFVMWYDPLCPVCRKALPHFERLYHDMKGKLEFGVINAMVNQDLAISQDIVAFPTFRLYRCNGKCTYKHHEGMLTYREMKSFIKCVKTELNLWRPRSYKLLDLTAILNTPCRSITCSSQSQTITNLPKYIKVGRNNVEINENVMEVNGNNFDEKIKAFNSVLVYFYTSWCVHCGKSLAEFVKAANLVEDSVGTMAICNAEDSLEIVDKYYVGKIPTVKFFRKGRYITDYIGELKGDVLVRFMKDPHIDEEFLLMVTRHKPFGDLHEGLVFTPTQKRKMMWSGKSGFGIIKEITNENIEETLRKTPSLLLLFYTCWSRICVGLKHDYITVAKAVEKTDVVLAAVDCEENVEIADRFLIHKFPTIKFFRDGKPVRDFHGDYHADEILKFLRDPSKLKPPTKGEHSSRQQDDEGVPKYWKGVEGGDKILHFTDFNHKQLLQNHPSILLMFYVPWCKPCTIMKREFAKAAIQMEPKHGVFGACDAERNNEMADIYSVIKLPTVKYLKNGEYVKDYVGTRKTEDFINFMMNPPEKKMLKPLSDFT